jgi:hypothetical protein
MARAGRRALKKAWRLRLSKLRRNRILLAVWALAYPLVFLIIRFLPFQHRSFWYGATMVGWLWAAEAGFFHGDRAGSIALGGLAEQWTSAALRKLGRRCWRVVDCVEFKDMDVDHVAVGPAGVLVVETKWSGEWTYQGEKLRTPFGDPIGQARRGASKIRSFLYSRGIHVDPIPMLCLWGPGLHDLPSGAEPIEDVLLLHGKQAKAWRTFILRMESQLGGDEVANISQELVAFVQKRDAYKRKAGRRTADTLLLTAKAAKG